MDLGLQLQDHLIRKFREWLIEHYSPRTIKRIDDLETKDPHMTVKISTIATKGDLDSNRIAKALDLENRKSASTVDQTTTCEAMMPVKALHTSPKYLRSERIARNASQIRA